jgi:hypothetical protein
MTTPRRRRSKELVIETPRKEAAPLLLPPVAPGLIRQVLFFLPLRGFMSMSDAFNCTGSRAHQCQKSNHDLSSWSSVVFSCVFSLHVLCVSFLLPQESSETPKGQVAHVWTHMHDTVLAVLFLLSFPVCIYLWQGASDAGVGSATSLTWFSVDGMGGYFFVVVGCGGGVMFACPHPHHRLKGLVFSFISVLAFPSPLCVDLASPPALTDIAKWIWEFIRENALEMTVAVGGTPAICHKFHVTLSSFWGQLCRACVCLCVCVCECVCVCVYVCVCV